MPRIQWTDGPQRWSGTSGVQRLRVATRSNAASTAIIDPVARTGQLKIGWTRSGDDTTATMEAQDGVDEPLQALSIINQHTSSFGGADMDLLWPDPGVSTPDVADLDFTQLDADILLCSRAGAEVYGVFLNVPRWMSMGTQDNTNHRILWPTTIGSFSHQDHVPPHPDNLVYAGQMWAAIAARYDGSGVDKVGSTGANPPAVNVSTWAMWNEMKGLFIPKSDDGEDADSQPGTWPDGNRHWYEHYIAMYDTAFAAMKIARPDGGSAPVRLGLGYVALATWARGRRNFQDVTIGTSSEARFLTRDFDVYRACLGLLGGVTGVAKWDGLVGIDVKAQSNDHFLSGALPTSVDQIGISEDPWDSLPRKWVEIIEVIDAMLASSTVPVTAGNDVEYGSYETYFMHDYVTNALMANGPFQLWAQHPPSSATENKLASLIAWGYIGSQEAGMGFILLWQMLYGWIDRATDATWPLGLYDSAGTATAAVAPTRWFKDNITGRTDVHYVKFANSNVKAIVGNGNMMIVNRSADAQDVIVNGSAYTVAADYGIRYLTGV